MIMEETVEQEPAECETLYLKTAIRHNHNRQEMVAIGIVERENISFQLVQFRNFEDHTREPVTVLQACLTDHEIDLVIEGLQKAQLRLRELNRNEHE
jgi:hypothetical protein